MYLRSPSMLPKIDAIPDGGSVIEISKRSPGNPNDPSVITDNDKYASRAYCLSSLSSHMNDCISASMTRQYNLSSAHPGISINNIVDSVYNLSSSNCTLSGLKTFKNTPILNGFQTFSSLDDKAFMTKKAVQDMILSSGITISQNADSPDPFDDNEHPIEKQTGDAEDNYVRMNFTDDLRFAPGRDGVEVKKDGYLVMWGWLADNGNVQAEMAWIRLEAYMNCGGDKKWIPIQVQPWIQGSQSRVLQYVSFNAFVTNGMRLRVKTGFDVNLNNGAFSNTGSMTYAENVPCAFFGYIIKTQN